LSAIEARLAGLVHASARGDPAERGRHERLTIARLTAGALALAVIPPFLLWHGAPSSAEHLVLAAMAGPLLAAAILARTGLLVLAQVVVSLSLAAPIVGFAAASGDLISLFALALLVLPAEAALSGSRRAVIAAGLVALLSLVAIALLDAAGHGSMAEPPAALWLAPPLLVVAIGHGTVALLARSRRLDAGRDPFPADRSTFAVIDDLVTWHDRNGHVVDASPAATKLLGLPPGAPPGARPVLPRPRVRPAGVSRAVSEARSACAPSCRVRLHAAAGDAPGDGCEAPAGAVGRDARAPGSGNAPADAAVVAVTRDPVEAQKARGGDRRRPPRRPSGPTCPRRLLATVSHELRTP
jgi:cell cycle sensor histidine kinase DivJ